MIRLAGIGDLAGIMPLAAILNPPWTENSVRDALTKEHADVAVYTDSGAVIGFICIEYVAGEGCITAIAVYSAARRRGIGKKLIDFAESLREKSNIYLEAEESNIAAIRLYEKCGYTARGKRQNYYGKTAAIIMNKEF